MSTPKLVAHLTRNSSNIDGMDKTWSLRVRDSISMVNVLELRFTAEQFSNLMASAQGEAMTNPEWVKLLSVEELAHVGKTRRIEREDVPLSNLLTTEQYRDAAIRERTAHDWARTRAAALGADEYKVTARHGYAWGASFIFFEDSE